jgi:putative ABC transport system ATP-binding protein
MLIVDKITKIVGDRLIFKNLSLIVEPGKILLVKGESGKGKTTLLNIASLLDLPSDGGIYFDNKNANTLNDGQKATFRAKNIGILFQNHNLLGSFTVYENLLFAGYADNLEISKKECKILLEKYGVKVDLNQKAGLLSGGESQRVSFIRCLINKPKYLFLDEPTSSLDKTNKSLIKSIIYKASLEGYGIMIVTHEDSFDDIASNIFIIS